MFLGKDVYSGDVEGCERVHAFIKAVNYLVDSCSEESVILSEVVKDYDFMKKFYGTADEIEVELNYNFPAMTGLWFAILNKNTSYLSNNQEAAFSNIPNHGGWVNFLRNHDGLTFESDNGKSVISLKKKLTKRGMQFMAGLNVAGRTFSFLDKDIDRHILAHLLLASQPGAIALYYGDELGMENDYEYMDRVTKGKNITNNSQNIIDDPRDINRAPISLEDIDSEKGKKIYKAIAEMLKIREKYRRLFSIKPLSTKTTPDTFYFEYKFENKTLSTIVNLSEKENRVKKPDGKEILKVGVVKEFDGFIQLEKNSGVWIEN